MVSVSDWETKKSWIRNGELAVDTEVRISLGAFLRVKVPAAVPPGVCEIHVSNANGKSNVIRVMAE